MEDETPRQLFKQIGTGSMAIVMSSPEGTITSNSVSGSSWESIPLTPGINVAMMTNRTYVDLSGYALDDLTTFLTGVQVQDARTPVAAVGAGNLDTIQIYDFLTTRFIKDSELVNYLAIPGFQPSTMDLQQVVWGRRLSFATNTTVAGTYINVDSELFGSGNAIASTRLHWTRLLITYPTGPGVTIQVTVYPSNLVCQALTGHEMERVYVNRLARSYTQQRPDTDGG